MSISLLRTGSSVIRGRANSRWISGARAYGAAARTEKGSDSGIHTTKLTNGMRIATMDAPGAAASVGVFVDAGTRYETVANAGVTNFVKHATFKTTDRRSNFRMVRELEHTGGHISASYGREQFSVSGCVLKPQAYNVVERFADALQPALHWFEVEDCRPGVEADVLAHDRSVKESMLTAIHRTAFGTQGLGLPLVATLQTFETITYDDVKKYLDERFVPANMAVIGVGVPLGDLQAAVDAAFTHHSTHTVGASEGGKAAVAPKAASKYLGGQTHIPTACHDSHYALMFNGLPHGDKNMAALAILGDLLAHYGNAKAVLLPYTDAGLFGVATSAHTGAGLGKSVSNIVKLISESGKSTASDALAAAKKRVKLDYLLAADSRGSAFGDFGRAVLADAAYVPPSAVVKAIDAVSAADVVAVSKKVFKSAPTVVTVGDNSHTPSYVSLLDSFKSL